MRSHVDELPFTRILFFPSHNSCLCCCLCDHFLFFSCSFNCLLLVVKFSYLLLFSFSLCCNSVKNNPFLLSCWDSCSSLQSFYLVVVAVVAAAGPVEHQSCRAREWTWLQRHDSVEAVDTIDCSFSLEFAVYSWSSDPSWRLSTFSHWGEPVVVPVHLLASSWPSTPRDVSSLIDSYLLVCACVCLTVLIWLFRLRESMDLSSSSKFIGSLFCWLWT